mmetsp:Transcript_41228/g.129156  ORF Transcript_41228/g.129156 Transcript_41228/m.129156 type:complete len:209 (+) Transcript_41228:1101-1727(+)
MEASTFLQEMNGRVPYTFSWYTSSAKSTKPSSCASVQSSASSTSERQLPVGLPGLMNTMARTLMPLRRASWMDLRTVFRFRDQPVASSSSYGTSEPLYRPMEAEYSGYCGMGTSTPSFTPVSGARMHTWKSMRTPSLAPFVRNTLSVLPTGVPSRRAMNSVTSLRTPGRPWLCVYAPTLGMFAMYFSARATTSSGSAARAAGSSSCSG